MINYVGVFCGFIDFKLWGFFVVLFCEIFLFFLLIIVIVKIIIVEVNILLGFLDYMLNFNFCNNYIYLLFF